MPPLMHAKLGQTMFKPSAYGQERTLEDYCIFTLTPFIVLLEKLRPIIDKDQLGILNGFQFYSHESLIVGADSIGLV